MWEIAHVHGGGGKENPFTRLRGPQSNIVPLPIVMVQEWLDFIKGPNVLLQTARVVLTELCYTINVSSSGDLSVYFYKYLYSEKIPQILGTVSNTSIDSDVNILLKALQFTL